MQSLEIVHLLIEKIHILYMYRSKSIVFDVIFVKNPFFCCLSVLNHDVCHLYTHEIDFLLILTYKASCVQNLEIVHPLITKKSNKSIALDAT